MLDKKLKARGLSAKLLLMTIGFVMLAESVLFIPSAAIYRQTWIMDRVQQAQILAQAITGVPNYKASEMLSKDFITQTDVELVALKKDGTTQLVLGAPPQTMDFITVDMTNPRRLPLFRDAFGDFFSAKNQYLRVIAPAAVQNEGVDDPRLELIISRDKLRESLWDYFERILLLSIVIAIITGGLIYLSNYYWRICGSSEKIRNINKTSNVIVIAKMKSEN